MENNIFTKPLRVPRNGEKVYALTQEDITKILTLRGSKVELDPGMGGVSPKTLDEHLLKNELASIDLAITSACNFKCVWCYRPGEEWGKLKIPFYKISEVVQHSADLGVKYFILTGGEPMMYKDGGKDYFDVVDQIYKEYKKTNIEPKILTFSDVALINKDRAKKLADRKVGLCLKRDSLDYKIQDGILQTNGGSKQIEQGYENLFAEGYGLNLELPISVNSVLAKGIKIPKGIVNTLDGMIDLHRWVRTQGMEHSIVPIHYCGEASDESQVEGINPLEVKVLYDIISEIDKKQFNDPWDVYSGFPKNKTCNRPGRGVHIRATGKVTSCSESPLIDNYVFGDIRKQNLKEIILSEKFQSFRKEFSNRNGKYICNSDVCDLNANNLCRGGCATRSAFSRIDPETGLIEQNTDMTAYSKGREDPLCPGWIVLAQKQGVLRKGLYEQVAKDLLDNSKSLDADTKQKILNSIIKKFYSK